MPSYPQYLEAAAAARRVAGVWNLQNHLEVVLPAGNYRDDATLTITANDALTLNVAVPDGVEATTSNGDITLTGTVNYGSERTAAEQAVTYLTGVRNVRDDIGISTDADPVDVTLNAQDALVPAPQCRIPAIGVCRADRTSHLGCALADAITASSAAGCN